MRHTAVCFAILLCVASTARAATLPVGFSETTISGIVDPTAFGLAPDGRIFVCQQDGSLRVIKDGALLAVPFVTLPVETAGERGLLGVTFDPDFLTNHYLYVYYTAATPAIHNRISRFTASGDVAAPGSELVILDLDNLSSSAMHNGGALHFGLDGKLYAAVGENATASNSQTLANLLGKMLRINSDGTIPADNPFYDTATGNNRAIWALGLRNPFTFGVHPLSGRIFIDDVGSTEFEEINDGMPGANYGWPATEGPTGNPDYVSPLHWYGHGSECAITGGTFYSPEVRQFGSAYVDSYFFADLCAGWIRRLDTLNASNGFATAISNPVDLLVGHDGSLYYLSRGDSAVGRIRWDNHLKGDVNNDGNTDQADLFFLISYLYAGGPAPIQGGDVDDNGQINSADLTYLTTYLLGRGPGPVVNER